MSYLSARSLLRDAEALSDLVEVQPAQLNACREALEEGRPVDGYSPKCVAMAQKLLEALAEMKLLGGA